MFRGYPGGELLVTERQNLTTSESAETCGYRLLPWVGKTSVLGWTDILAVLSGGCTVIPRPLPRPKRKLWLWKWTSFPDDGTKYPPLGSPQIRGTLRHASFTSDGRSTDRRLP